MFKSLGDLTRRLLPKRPAATVQVSDAGMTLVEGSRTLGRFAWDDVRAIVTFKRDLGTVDEIRLAFRVADSWVEVGEDCVGWSELIVAVGRHFPAAPPDWLAAVMFPAFEPCDRVLYERDGSTASPEG